MQGDQNAKRAEETYRQRAGQREGSGQHFLHYNYIYGKNIQHSRSVNSEVKSPIWPEFKLIRNCMPAQMYPQVLLRPDLQ